MASSGPNNPSAASNDTSIGSVSWTTPTNVYSSNGARAFYGPFASAGVITYYLKVTGFGFSIPSGATIDGIVVEYERNNPLSGTVKDYAVRIVKGGTIGSTDKSTATAWPNSQAYESHGGASDLWGETWTDSDINASNFGVAISATQSSGSGGYSQIDHVRATVYYTVAAAGQPMALRQSQSRTGFARVGRGF